MSHQILSKDTMFSVRDVPWHGLGTVLDEYPESITEAIEKSGLGWKVRQGDLMVVERPEFIDDFGETVPAKLTPAKGYRANLREDDGALLGIVSDDYKVVQNEEAFRFLDALIASDLHFETAGSLQNGKRVWVLARRPDFVEVGGDETATFVYVANAHDGSMAVTSAVTPIRIVCANTLNYALRKSEARAERVYKFRHTGDLQLKFDEARRVMGMTINYEQRFKELGDRLATERFTVPEFEDLTKRLVPINEDELGPRAVKNRQAKRELFLDVFRGKGPDGDTTGNAPGTKWTALNAVGEVEDWYRRTTKRTDQVSRSFEDQNLKHRAFEILTAA